MYQSGYSELTMFEIFLTGFLLLSVFLKKDKLVMIGLGGKLIIHDLVLGDIFWFMSRPLMMITVKTCLPLILKQIIYIIILIWMIRSELKKNYKKVFFGILLLFCIELLSSFVYYPVFMESVTKRCPECIKVFSKSQIERYVAYIASAPFTQIKNRLLLTFTQIIVFGVQYLLHRKDKTEW